MIKVQEGGITIPISLPDGLMSSGSGSIMHCEVYARNHCTYSEERTAISPHIRLQLDGQTEVRAKFGQSLLDFTATANSIAIFGSGVSLEKVHWNSRKSRCLVIGLSENLALHDPSIFEKLNRGLAFRAAFLDPALASLLHAVRSQIEKSDSAHPLVLDHLGLAMCAYLEQNYCSGQSTIPKPLTSRASTQRAIDYMESHLSSKFTLAQIAKASGLSAFHFARTFKAQTGQTPFAYLYQARIAAARRMIAEDKESLADIAEIVGFSSQSHLTRAFTKATGISPGQARRRNQPK